MLPVEAFCSRTRSQVHAPHSCQLIQWTDLTGVDNPIDSGAVAKKQSDGLRSSIKQIQCEDAPGGIEFAASLRSARTASRSPPISRTSHQLSAVLRGATNLPKSPSSAPTTRGRSHRRCTRPAGTPHREFTRPLLKFPSAHRIHRLLRLAAVAFHVISQQCPPPTEGRRRGKAPKSLAVTRWWTRGVLPPSHADPPSHNPSAD